MREFRRSHGLIGTILPAILLTVACSRSISVPEEGATQGNPAPFHGEGSKDGSATGSDPSAHATQENGLPFHDSQSLPAGTLLTVRLKDPIMVESPGPNDSFEAVVDHAVVIDGDTLLPRGVTVVGRIESARVSKMKPDRGYARLALESVRVGAINVPVQTASLFARQTPSTDVPASTVHLEKGRRLTFRLTEPVFLTTQRTQATR